MSAIDRLKQVLNEKGIKVPEFQRMINISSQTWNNWNKRDIPAKMIFPIAEALQINTDWLAKGIGEKYSSNQPDRSRTYFLQNLIEESPLIQEKDWKSLPPKMRAFIEDYLNKCLKGQITLEHVKILHDMIDALTKDCHI